MLIILVEDNMPTGIYPGNKGKKLSKEHKTRIGKGLKGKCLEEKSYRWSEKPTYLALHKWVYRKLGRANYCERCGLTKVPKGLKRYFEWSNKSRKYKRDLKDWEQLCIKCHRNLFPITKETRQKMSKSRNGDKNGNWKGGISKYIKKRDRK